MNKLLATLIVLAACATSFAATPTPAPGASKEVKTSATPAGPATAPAAAKTPATAAAPAAQTAPVASTATKATDSTTSKSTKPSHKVSKAHNLTAHSPMAKASATIK